MKLICLYFQVHQPFRLRPINLFKPNRINEIFDKASNQAIFDKITGNCYLPTNQLLLHLLEKYPGFRLSFSLSGTFLEQLKNHGGEVLTSFIQILNHPSVEILSETYTHGLSFLKGKKDFFDDIGRHKVMINSIADKPLNTFRNTELIYSNEIGEWLHELEYQSVLVEGADKILNGKTPTQLYHHPKHKSLNLFTKNYVLSDDIAFRFSDKSSQNWPLTTNKWLNAINDGYGGHRLYNIFMDYETFGEHQPKSSGIFKFLAHLPQLVKKHKNIKFVLPQEATSTLSPQLPLSMPAPVSWADQERDTSAWIGNSMQLEALDAVYQLETKVKDCKDKAIFDTWLHLQTSDHFYYMSTKTNEDGSIHAYFSPYNNAHEAFTNYMHAIKLLEHWIDNA